MTAKEFLADKTLTAVETVDNLIISLVVEEISYGLNVNTSSVEAYSPVTRTTDFSINGDILTSGSISVNLAETNMLGMTTEEVKED